MRVYDFSAAQAGLLLGAMGASIAVMGTVAAGAIGDRISRNAPSRRLRLVAVMVLIATPLYMASKLAPTPQLFFIFAALSAVAGSFYLPLTSPPCRPW
jgi:MFS family permease